MPYFGYMRIRILPLEIAKCSPLSEVQKSIILFAIPGCNDPQLQTPHPKPHGLDALFADRQSQFDKKCLKRTRPEQLLILPGA